MRSPFPRAALGLVLLAAASVEGIFDAAPHSALRLGQRRREAGAMGLAPHNPLGFVGPFDDKVTSFFNGIKDFALGGISGACAAFARCCAVC